MKASKSSSSKSQSKERPSHDDNTGTQAGGNGVTIANAPTWLLDAMAALDDITSEYPKAMSILSAILITAGSIPAIPAITAGAGGALLASGTAQAVGTIAIGVGQALGYSVKKTTQERQEKQVSTNIINVRSR